MNKLNDLIKELCPNGVRYEKIGDIGKVCMCKRIMKNQTRPTGDIPFYKIGTFGGKADAYISNELFDEYSTKYSYPKKNEILISCSGTIGRTVIFDGEKSYFQDSNIVWVSNDEQKVLNKFLYYFYQTFPWKIYDGGVIKRLYNNIIEQTAVPVPPLEVQCEIVHILDNFTLLSAELSAELKARQKQYEYYRDELIKLENLPDAKMMKLKDIATEFYRGNGIKRDEVTETGIPCVRYGEIYTTYNIWFDKCESYTTADKIKNKKYFENGDILFAITGESIEEIAKSIVYVGNERCLAGGDIVVMKHKQNPKYLSYALSTNDAVIQKGKGKVKSKVVHSNVPSIQEIEIPIPSLEKQQEIADKLDRFHNLLNNISEGLPAEIEARQKQYEYYRDKLLNFKELKEE